MCWDVLSPRKSSVFEKSGTSSGNQVFVESESVMMMMVRLRAETKEELVLACWIRDDFAQILGEDLLLTVPELSVSGGVARRSTC